jgi:hypothetical protein
MECAERTIYMDMQHYFACKNEQNNAEDSGVLGCDAVLLSEGFFMFWRNAVPSFSRGKHLLIQ